MGSANSSPSLLGSNAGVVDFRQIRNLPDGRIVNLEGDVVDCAPRVEKRRENESHKCQQLMLKSNGAFLSVVIWDSEELAVKPGQRLKVTRGIVSTGRVHILNRSHLSFETLRPLASVTQESAPSQPVEKKWEDVFLSTLVKHKPRLMKLIAEELQRLNEYAFENLPLEEAEKLRQLAEPILAEDLQGHQNQDISEESLGEVDGVDYKFLDVTCPDPECKKAERIAIKMDFNGTKKISVQHEGHTLHLKVDKDLRIRRFEIVEAAVRVI